MSAHLPVPKDEIELAFDPRPGTVTGKKAALAMVSAGPASRQLAEVLGQTVYHGSFHRLA